ncbi:MAG TPA: zinc-binding alcohol dehydrogenase, partial [Chloroflexota bacterium]|nr:zinc-binding alcohol dehydrogenase [Chloroflexota bacterium]
MRSYDVCFPEANRAILLDREVSPDDLGPGQALVRGEYSIISAGTELANFTHLADEAPALAGRPRWPGPFPRYPGYGHLGTVVAVGPDSAGVAPGDRILTFANHGSLVKADLRRFFLPVPPDAAGRRAVFTRMAGVAITAVRASSVAAGDRVVVIGMGLVGNFAAQLLRLSGADVLAVDLSPHRLEIARKCGIREVVNPSETNLADAVQDWTGGKGARITVEAIGRSELIAQAVELTGRHGEVILLGSPRARVMMDATPMLSRIHMLAIKLIGSLEWTYPMEPTEHAHFSIRENYAQILHWIQRERLTVDPLLSHVLSPSDCQQAYDGLLNRKDEYLGAIFDWR